MKAFYLVRTIAVFAILFVATFKLCAGEVQPINVLFLGDNGHHVPADRFKELKSGMLDRNISFTYTDQMDDINVANLSKYDVLMIYANQTKISADQERALLDFVATGHGLVPIHCASACFGNSPAYIDLVGGRFTRHGTGVFKETIVASDHPIMKGLVPIESWDETYVHDKLNSNRTDLATRVDEKGTEPYTWVREHGKGRVFYTAWGHDQRTWTNAGFQKLIENGIRWAAGANKSSVELKPKDGLKPFTYANADGPIPLYRSDSSLGKGGQPANQIQLPLSAEDSMAHIVVPPGFEVQLYASEPDIVKPICMTWDERGRLWIAETLDYPNDLQSPGQGHDRIKICEDTKGTGKADKFTVFAENLSIPTSLTFANGGVVVQQAPDTLFLKASKGDDHADVRRTIISGWGTGDTHAGPSNLHWGMDNWIWGMLGYSGFNGTVGDKKLSFHMGFYRFKPDGSQLEYIRSSNNNTWGYGISEDNLIFGSTANNNASMYMPIPNRYYESVKGFSPSALGTIANSQKFYPITDKYRQVDFFGNYTAGTGHMLYTARAFPKEYWNKMAFVAEPTGHLVGMFRLMSNGADFTALNNKSFLASDDEWCAPIAAEVGPDGALWVIDWYNYIVQHNPTPRGFTTGKRGAYETPLRDKKHGRIYRIVYKGEGSKEYQPIRLDNASPEKLVETLKNDNQFWRLQAQRLLVERGQRDVLPALYELIHDSKLDEIGMHPSSIHALWTLQGLNVLDGSNADANQAVIAALRHPCAGTRRAAIMVISRTSEGLAALLSAQTLEDFDAQVRMATFLALSEMPTEPGVGKILLTAMKEERNSKDKWIPHAATSAAARHDIDFLKAALTTLQTSQAFPVNPKEPKISTNALINPSFENDINGKPASWSSTQYGGNAEFQWSEASHKGAHSVFISSTTGADAGWLTTVEVVPNSDYRLSGWIKTENVKGAKGALLNIHELQLSNGAMTPPLQGTQDWTHVETIFNSGELKQIGINCLFGGWGTSTGKAWFDDLELTRLGGKSVRQANDVNRILQIVSGHFARRGSAESIFPLMSLLKEADPNIALLFLEALDGGWSTQKPLEISQADAAELTDLMKSLPENARPSLLSLADKWGKKELFKDTISTISNGLATCLSDGAEKADQRIDAAKKLLRLSDTPENIQLILNQIVPQAAPSLNTGMLSSLSESKQADVGRLLVQKWKLLTPYLQRTAIALLLTRTEWTAAVLDGMEKGELKKGDLAVEFWSQLKGYPDPSIQNRVKRLEVNTESSTNQNLKATLEKLLPITAQAGNSMKGRVVFERNCISCHTLNGQGGQIGPILTGFGAHPKAEILTAIVDPNASVEANFKLWTLKTTDGQLIQGRLESESQTSVELLDTTGKKYEIERKNIKVFVTDNKSMMPEGFGASLTSEELCNLLEYISESKVK